MATATKTKTAPKGAKTPATIEATRPGQISAPRAVRPVESYQLTLERVVALLVTDSVGGFSQRQLAEKLDIARASLSKILESGMPAVTPPDLYRNLWGVLNRLVTEGKPLIDPEDPFKRPIMWYPTTTVEGVAVAGWQLMRIWHENTTIAQQHMEPKLEVMYALSNLTPEQYPDALEAIKNLNRKVVPQPTFTETAEGLANLIRKHMAALDVSKPKYYAVELLELDDPDTPSMQNPDYPALLAGLTDVLEHNRLPEDPTRALLPILAMYLEVDGQGFNGDIGRLCKQAGILLP